MTSKYDRLGDHLAAIGAATIALTFAEVADWWGATRNGRYVNAHATHWRQVGYAADLPDVAAETDTFRRVKP